MFPCLSPGGALPAEQPQSHRARGPPFPTDRADFIDLASFWLQLLLSPTKGSG